MGTFPPLNNIIHEDTLQTKFSIARENVKRTQLNNFLYSTLGNMQVQNWHWYCNGILIKKYSVILTVELMVG